ncbi:hypothetical protein Godav_007676, partial [Gossypium davidsonii]|nr:hypothetical protein [Gossypium davidsonii]
QPSAKWVPRILTFYKPLHNFSLPPFSDNLVICKQRSKNRKKIIKDPQETEGSDQPNSDATQTPVSERKQKIVLNLKMRLKNSICEIANHEEPKASGQLNPHKASDVTQRRKTDHHHQPEIIVPTKKNAAALEKTCICYAVERGDRRGRCRNRKVGREEAAEKKSRKKTPYKPRSFIPRLI